MQDYLLDDASCTDCGNGMLKLVMCSIICLLYSQNVSLWRKATAGTS